MGKVVVSFKILPANIDVKLDSLRESIKRVLPEETLIFKFEEEPVAFGIVALITHIIMPEDISGEMDKVERCIKEAEGVGQVDVLMVRRF